MKLTRYEEALASSMHHNAAENLFFCLALAERGGISNRAYGWLRLRADQQPERKFRFDFLGIKPFDEVATFWELLRQGDHRAIFDGVQKCLQKPTELSDAFVSLIQPLVILERGTVLSSLYSENADKLGGFFPEQASFNLGADGDWDNALSILDRAHRDGAAAAHFPYGKYSLMWKFAYIQGRVDDVLPRLAAIPFDRELPHAAEARTWQLAAYQIRAGRTDVRVPTIDSGTQLPSYLEAAALQIATLADVPSAAETVAELRRTLKPRTLQIQHADTGFSYQMEFLPDELFRAEVRVAARRQDHAKLLTLAQTEPSSLAAAPDVVIDALIEEGDWRTAAHIAGLYDVRDRPLIPGFDDTRIDEYSELQLILAAAAARDGDDAAAEDFLARHIEALAFIREIDEPLIETERASDLRLGWWPAALLAGAAEGKVPRKILSVLLPVFRDPY